MKIVCVGDVYITPEMMTNGIAPYLKPEDTVETFFFGMHDRDEKMRDMLRHMESGGRRDLPIPEGFVKACEDADLLIVHVCPVNEDAIEGAKNLKAIMACRGGLENIAVEAATQKGIIVSNNPAHNANAVAEYTMGMILSETRNIARADGALKKGVWRETFPNSVYTIRELSDMTVGIIGFGAIGRLVAEKLVPFRSRVLVSDPWFTGDPAQYPNCEFVSKEELLAQADIVTLHARTTKPIMGEAEFALMKDHSYLINSSRAIAIDSAAFEKAMDSGKLLGAAIDVFETEPEIPAFYRKYDNITITNHRGGDTINSYKDAPGFAMKNYLGYLAGKDLLFWANRPKK